MMPEQEDKPIHPFTDQEAQIFTMLRAVGDEMLELDGLSPNQAMEIGIHVRQLQSILMARAFKRQYPLTFRNPSA